LLGLPLKTGGCVRKGIRCKNCGPNYEMEKDHCKFDPYLKKKIWTLNENDDDGFILVCVDSHVNTNRSVVG